MFDYGQNKVEKDPEKKPEQTNASTEFQAPRMSSFTTPSSAVTSSPIIRRGAPTVELTKRIKPKKSKGKKSKGKKSKVK